MLKYDVRQSNTGKYRILAIISNDRVIALPREYDTRDRAILAGIELTMFDQCHSHEVTKKESVK
jgi:uncharacterized protein YegP (UPF0339 family)